jgi:NADH-quinone oxidoreductase subunit M
MNFIGELMVFIGSWKAYPVQTILAAIAVTITWAYYVRMIRAIFFGETPQASPHAEMSNLSDARSLVDRLPLVLLTAIILIFGIFPSPFIRVIQSGVAPILARIDHAPSPSHPTGQESVRLPLPLEK